MENPDFYRQLTVTAGQRTYPVVIGYDLLHDKMLLPYVTSSQVLIVTDSVVAPLYLARVQAAFASLQCDVVVLPAGESFKTADSVQYVYNALIKHHHHRDTTLVALGGGVITDLAGFVASTYQRGVALISIPTTLLAQVDASIGGKTGINHPMAKNMIGSFYQPQAVIMDLSTLVTLPLRIFRAGLAEVIKYAVLSGAEMMHMLTRALEHGLADNRSSELGAVVYACCEVKAAFVKADERDNKERLLLNLGHTFAHALETFGNYDRFQHGEAVAIGLYCAALLSCQKGYVTGEVVTQIDNLLSLAHLPRRIPADVDSAIVQDLMNSDKKIAHNCLRFILMKRIGQCVVDLEVTPQQVTDVLLRARGEESVC